MPELESSNRYYYADDKKIPLTLSRRFVAVKTSGAAAERSAAASRLASALSATPGAARVFDLPQYNLTVVAVPEDGNGARTSLTGVVSAETVRSLVAAQPDLQAGPQVYESAETPGGQALIAIDEVLVKFKPGVADDARRRLLTQHKLDVKRTDYPEPDAYLLAVRDEQDPIEVANRLHESEHVEWAHPNFAILTPRLEVRTVEGATDAALPEGTEARTAGLEAPPEPLALVSPAERLAPPSDPGFASQWGLKKIKAPEAWDISMGNPAISIAVIDEGCDLSHEDLVYKTPGYDAYDGDNNPSPQPQDAHGTACAGVATARANNSRGGAGVAPNCKVLPVRIARGIGGGFWDTTPAKVADGIHTAVDRGADALSNSYQIPPATVVTNAFKYAQTNGRGGKGCPIAAASGNGDIHDLIYPAELSPTIPGFLAVGASNEWDQRKSKTSLDGENWWGSNWGPELDVVAPGVHIYTSDIMGAAGYGGGNYISNFNGTSSATPHVAGLMALILSVDPDLRSWEVEDIIKLTADDLGTAGRDEQFGFGRINCRRALEAASRLWYQITIGVEFLGAGKECFMRAAVRMYNPGINTVRVDSLTLTSHTPTWTAEIDRFEYRPNPGNVLAPRSGQDIRLNRILLKANGNQASWSYRWALNWTYTFWRPSAPGFPLAAMLAEGEGRTATARTVTGGSSGQRPEGAGLEVERLGFTPLVMSGLPAGNGGRLAGDSIVVDRQSRAITIVIR